MVNISEKKVLIISNSYSDGDAITGSNLFHFWKKKNLFCASGSQNSLQNVDYFSSMYFLGNKERYSFLPFNKLIPISKSEVVTPNTLLNQSDSQISSNIFVLYKKYIYPLLSFFGLYEIRFLFRISKDFCDWIDTINPDYIYTSLGSYGMASFILKCKKRFPNIKFIIHTYDDWLTPNRKHLLVLFLSSLSNKIFKKIIAESTYCLTISELMAEEYSRRYCHKFDTVYNSVSITKKQPLTTNLENIYITYIGKIGGHNYIAINDMIESIGLINNFYKKKILFNIYSGTDELSLKRYLKKTNNYVNIYDKVPNNEIIDILRKSSLLFLPISISRKNISIVKYSFSTKIAEYFASFVPVVYYGPENVAMEKVFTKYECAYILTERNISKLVDLVLIALCEKAKSKIIVQNAYKFLTTKMDREIVALNFYNLLNSQI